MARYRTLDVPPNLKQAIEDITADDLKKLNKFLPSNHKLTRKAEIVAEILRHLQGEKLKETWNLLDTLQQAAVAEAIHGADTTYSTGMFVAKYGQEPDWGEVSPYGWRLDPSILHLFFYDNIIPPDLQKDLLSFVPKPQPAVLNSMGENLPEKVVMEASKYNYKTGKRDVEEREISLFDCEMESKAPKDFTAILRLIQAGKILVSDKTYLPNAVTVKTIAKILQNGDFYDDEQRKLGAKTPDSVEEIGAIKAFAWALLMQGSNFAELSGKKLVLTKTGQKALQTPPDKSIQTIWKRWLKTTTFDEMRRIDAIKGQTGKGARGMTAVPGRRSAIVSNLKACPVNQWITFSEFSRYLLATGNRFDVTRDIENLYIAESGYGGLNYSDSSNWGILQERYMRCLLFEYAATLGIIDVAYTDPSAMPRDFEDYWGTDDLSFFSRYDGLLAFRLTALGAYCLELTDTYTPPVVEVRQTLRVLPNLEIVVAGEEIASADALVLDLYTQKVSDVVWRLDRPKLFAAIENGNRLQELTEVLETRSIEPLPATVQQFLADAAERAQGLQYLGTAVLIECTNPHLALLIANDARTKKFCQLAGDRHLVVLSAQESKFRTALRQMGYVLPPN